MVHLDEHPAGEPVPDRRRPRDRSRQILLNAGELFARDGFHSIRMEDIAGASGVTARALYRHFASKQSLLSAVIREDQDRLLAVLDAESPEATTPEQRLEDLISRLAVASLKSLRLGPLWQREARNLEPHDFDRVRAGTRRIGHAVRDAIEAARPELAGFPAALRAWVAVSIVTSPGHNEPSLPRRRLAELLVNATLTAVDTPASLVNEVSGRCLPGSTLHRRREHGARREQLIAAAAAAFRERGYGGVGLDGFGIAGPAVYRYFDGKAKVLETLIVRFHEWMALESERALREDVPDDKVIECLIAGYVRLAVEATDLLAVSVTESMNLPGDAADRQRRIRADDLAEWCRWLRVAREDLSEDEAQALVIAVRTAINDVVRIPSLLEDPDFRAELTACSLYILTNSLGR